MNRQKKKLKELLDMSTETKKRVEEVNNYFKAEKVILIVSNVAMAAKIEGTEILKKVI